MEEKKDKKFHLALILGSYLVLDIIILFVLCVLELNGLDHQIALIMSFILEFLSTLYVARKGNLRSAIVFYIVLLVSSCLLGLLAMGMYSISDKMYFTPTILVLFRNGYSLDGAIMNGFMRFLLTFRIPALVAIIYSWVMYCLSKN